MRDYEIVSTDSHLEVPPDSWRPFVDPEFQDYAPKVVKLPNGGDAWLMPGKENPVPLGLNFSAGRGFENLKVSGLSYADGLVGAGNGTQRCPRDGRGRHRRRDPVPGGLRAAHARHRRVARRGLRGDRARLQRLALAGIHRGGPRPAARPRHPPGHEHRRRDRRAAPGLHHAGHPRCGAARLAERLGHA